MSKYVIGNYTNVADVEAAVNDLIRKGYPRESISLIANKTIVSNLGNAGVAIESDFDYENADEGMWDRFRNFFGFEDDAEHYRAMLATHRQDIQNGNVLVIVNDALLPSNFEANWAETGTEQTLNSNPLEADSIAQDTGDETLRLQEERLNVDKEDVQTGEVVIKKRVVEENRTVDVPVKHEELVVERRPVSGEQASADDFGEETFSIPLREEQVYVTKEPVVTEEVHIRKRDVEDTKHVSASVRREELDMEKAGNVVVEGADPSQSAAAPPM